jgi:hypothetical protein
LLIPELLAVIVTAVCVVTTLWLTLKVTVVFPLGTVTDAETPAALEFELDSLTTKPPEGAGPVNATVPVTAVVEPPLTVPGETETDANVVGSTVSVVWAELPLCEPVIKALTAVETALVWIAKLPVMDPIGTDTLAGTAAAFADEESLTTTAPLPVPGAAFRVTEPVAVEPPDTDPGFALMDSTWNGFRTT